MGAETGAGTGARTLIERGPGIKTGGKGYRCKERYEAQMQTHAQRRKRRDAETGAETGTVVSAETGADTGAVQSQVQR